MAQETPHARLSSAGTRRRAGRRAGDAASWSPCVGWAVCVCRLGCVWGLSVFLAGPSLPPCLDGPAHTACWGGGCAYSMRASRLSRRQTLRGVRPPPGPEASPAPAPAPPRGVEPLHAAKPRRPLVLSQPLEGIRECQNIQPLHAAKPRRRTPGTPASRLLHAGKGDASRQARRQAGTHARRQAGRQAGS